MTDTLRESVAMLGDKAFRQVVELPGLRGEKCERPPDPLDGFKKLKFGAVMFDVFTSPRDNKCYARAYCNGIVAWYEMTAVPLPEGA